MGGSYQEVATPLGRRAGAVHAAPRRADRARPRLRADPRRRQRAAARVLRCGIVLPDRAERPRQGRAWPRRRTARIPGSATRIERIAGATTDLQHIVHQGMTHYDATFWVGANAVLRKRALDDIVEIDYEGELGDPPLHPGPDGHRGHRVDHRPGRPRLDAAQLPGAAGLQRHPARLRLAVHPAPAVGERRPADPVEAARAVAGPSRARREEPVRRSCSCGSTTWRRSSGLAVPGGHAGVPVQQPAC